MAAALWLTAVFAGSFAHAAEPKPAAPSTNHWAFQPITRPAVPAVRNKSWPRTPLDFFILAKLEEKGLSPSPPADRATLLRRVTFDLHGLPPSAAELDAFVEDASPDAFTKVVDRLLSSPRYGERWARHWLDLARFSESDGFEYDKMREHAWRYRDYVIRSLNEDKSYARFAAEQIAGDVFEPVTPDGIAATGFLVAGPYDEAGNSSVSTSLKARIREEEMEDIIAAVGQTFLGVTVNCARCHDHKFDPISQTDYYRLKAALDGVRRGNRPFATPRETQAREEKLASLKASLAEYESQISALESAVRARVAAEGQRRSTEPPNGAVQPRERTGKEGPGIPPAPIARWTFEGDAKDSIGALHGTLAGGATISNGRLKLDGKGAFVRTAPLARPLREKTLVARVSLADLEQRGGGVLSVEAQEGGTFDAIVFGERVPRRWMAGSSFFTRSRDLAAPDEIAKPGELVHVAIVYHADDSIAVYRNGVAYGEPYMPAGANSTLRTYAPGESHLLFGLRHTGAGNGFFAGDIEEACLFDRALTVIEVAALARGIGEPVMTDEQLAATLTDEERERRSRLAREIVTLHGQLKQLKAQANTLVYAAVSREPDATFVLVRGEIDKRGAQVSAGALAAVRSLAPEFGVPPDAPEARRRTRLAEWVTDPGNPLTWRVIVNRAWQHHFGRGLVGTPNDFGAAGERPSHPELLDWLAVEFKDRGQSLKALHRLIVTSATYAQAAAVQRANNSTLQRFHELDADNRLLWHYPLRRLEAEAVRDAMLHISGQLNVETGGPSFRPFKVTVSNSHFYELMDATGPEFNRRSIYRAGIQSGKDPLLDSLDCPDPSTKTPARSVTTTPIQALGLMNNAFVQRQAHYLAERLKAEAGGEARAQTRLAWRLAFGREPRREESKSAAALVREHGLESLCWALLNSSEFLYVR
jgi:hypothetical protein